MFRTIALIAILYSTGISAQEIKDTLYTNQPSKTIAIEYKDNTPFHGTLETTTDKYKIVTNYDEGTKLDSYYYTLDTNQLVGIAMYLVNDYIYKRTMTKDSIYQTEYKVKEGKLEDDYIAYENGEVKYKAHFDKGLLQEGTIAIKDVGIIPNYKAERNKKDTYVVLSLNKKTLKLVILDSQTNAEVYKMETKIKKNKQFLNTIHTKVITPDNLYPEYDLNLLDNFYNKESFLQRNK